MIPLTLSALPTVGIVANNSPAYIEQVFNALQKGTPVVPLRAEDDNYRITAAVVSEILIPEADGPWLNLPFTPQSSDELAIINFTSGTEGNPKGVGISHNNLADVVSRLNTVMQVDSSIREYIGVPVYLSFGFGRCRAVATAGGHAFIPESGLNPVEIATLLEEGAINAISAVPSQWRVLLENSDLFKFSGQTVRWIEIGSQYMSKEEKLKLKKLFPNAKIVQHYGLTEASRSTFLEIDSVPEEGLESVGKPYGNTQLKITEEGTIAIKGDHVAQGYLLDNQFKALTDEAGWFTTNDIGEEQNGYFYFKGRADDIINCGGLKLSPESLELSLKKVLPELEVLAICRRPDEALGDGFLLVVTKDNSVTFDNLYHTFIKVLRSYNVAGADAIAIVAVDDIPKTASGKVQRKLLSQEHQSTAIYKPNASAKSKKKQKLTANEEQMTYICEQIFNYNGLSIDENFFDLGISSLAIIQLITKISLIYNKELSTNDIFKAPTVRQLTLLVHSVDSDQRRDHAIDVLKNGNQNKLPFFFVGSPVYGNHLSKKLKSTRPMYALNIFGLETLYRDRLYSFTIDDIAYYFHKEIKKIQPEGPYYLGAFCADQKIAMEVARRLIDAGDDIAYFGFYDVTGSFTRRTTRIQKIINKLKTTGPSYFWLVAKRKFSDIIRKVKIFFGKRRFEQSQTADTELSLADRDQLVVQRFWQTNREYRPQPLSVDITAYRSKEWSAEPLDILHYCANKIDVEIIPGNHSSMFTDDNSLIPLAKLVDNKLK